MRRRDRTYYHGDICNETWGHFAYIVYEGDRSLAGLEAILFLDSSARPHDYMVKELELLFSFGM